MGARAVKCDTCGAADEIMEQAPEAAGHENRWLCSACGATNLIDGEPGHPGEGALNPGAAALSDDELAEAYQRRMGGSMAPGGDQS